jgi:hypothetical protein
VAKKRVEPLLAANGIAAIPALAIAGGGVNCSYDANGRLIQAARTGATNNGASGGYASVHGGKRTSKTIIGSPNRVPP